MMNDVGFNVSIDIMDTGSFLKLIQQGAEGGPLFAAEPLVMRMPGRRRRAHPAFPFRQYLDHRERPDLDRWLDDARATLDKAARQADYDKINKRIADQVPVIPLFQTVQIFGVAKPLRGPPWPTRACSSTG